MRRPFRPRGVGRSLLFTTFLAFAPAVLGATSYTILTTVDDAVVNGNCTLREAIRAANGNAAVDLCAAGGATDTIELPNGTYPFLGEEVLSGVGSLTIQGQSLNPFNVTIDLSNAGRFLSLSPPGSYVLAGLGIVNGQLPGGGVGGAIHASNASLLIYNFRFVSNDAGGGAGGAIFFVSDQAAASLIMHNGAFLSNSAVGTGLAAVGGAVSAAVSNGAQVDIRDAAFVGNQVNHPTSFVAGGAIKLDVGSGGSVGRCLRCTFDNNSANTLGVGSYHAFGGAVQIMVSAGRGELVDCRFKGNSATADATDEKVAVVHGGVSNSGALVLERLFVDDNGGPADAITSDVRLDASNKASTISFYDSQVTFGSGKGMLVTTDEYASALLGHLTIADYGLTGALLTTLGGTIELQNSIVALNGTNLTTSGSVDQSNNFVGGDPLFLDDQFGDYHLSALSTAINAGTNIVASVRPADLDHHGRIAETWTDMGCYEFDGLFADGFDVGDTGSWSSHTP